MTHLLLGSEAPPPLNPEVGNLEKLQSPLLAAVIKAAVTALIVGGVSFAQTTAPTITACVHKESGNVRIVAD